MSIELEPASQLSFRRPLTESIKETLIIRNPTQLPIAFKVKTTAPKQYCVRPNSGLVGPGQELEVQVQMQAMKEDPPPDFKCKDKFLVQSVAITAERAQLSATDLWLTVERDAKDQIREKKIRCAFLPPAEHAITQIKEEDEASSTHLSSAASSIHHTQSIAPASPAQITTTSTTTVSFSENRNSTSLGSSSTADAQTLKHELENARETIQNLQNTLEKLQKEASTLRQRKPESVASPTVTAVTLKHSQEGLYPVTYVAGAALISFIFAVLFF
ncbi:phosphatidylinositol-binding protein scs2 [Podila minutissima]|uniref:Phosphatidylinositol-binding protein scs2 n=1 Tax=Podila minutissima TaxID=64525 RepID=A0A9P5SDB6_9FUNG|nr:phosphatidylinositol-binding protein scs2 [Podila minutissima]